MQDPLTSAIYSFEHRLLPRIFYQAGIALIMDIQKPGRLEALAQSYFDEAFPGVRVPENFASAELFRIDEEHDDYFQVIEFGGPAECPLCASVFLYFTKDFGHAMYFTFEHEFDGSAPVFCGWTEDMKHVNYGDTAYLQEDQFEIVTKRAREWMYS